MQGSRRGARRRSGGSAPWVSPRPSPASGPDAVAHDCVSPDWKPPTQKNGAPSASSQLGSGTIRTSGRCTLAARGDGGIFSELGDEPGVVELHGPGGWSSVPLAAVGLVRADERVGGEIAAAGCAREDDRRHRAREQGPPPSSSHVKLIDGPGPRPFVEILARRPTPSRFISSRARATSPCPTGACPAGP